MQRAGEGRQYRQGWICCICTLKWTGAAAPFPWVAAKRDNAKVNQTQPWTCLFFLFSFSQGSQVLTFQTDENSGQKAREIQTPSSKNPSQAGWQGSSALPAPLQLTGPLQPAPQNTGADIQSFLNSPASLCVYLDSVFPHPLSLLTAFKSSVAEAVSG